MKIRKLLTAACGCFALLFGTTAAQAAENVVEVGGTVAGLKTGLETAMRDNDCETFTTVKLSENITFGEGDTWEPMLLARGVKLVLDGNGKTITGLPNSLFALKGPGSENEQYLRINDLTFEKARAVNTDAEYVSVILTGALDYVREATFKNVTIDHASVSSGDYAGAFIGYASLSEADDTVTFENCKVLNSTIQGVGFVGALIGHANGGKAGVVKVVSAEVKGNTIVGTELKDNTPRTDIVGSVVGSIGAGDASVSATVSDNKVYGSTSAVDAETPTKDTDEVTTVYDRGKGGELTIAGGTYDALPIAAGDSAWAKVDEWCTLVEQDGLFKVVDNLATLGNVKARQRYPWNGLVDITFELKSKNAARIFIVAEYMDGGVMKRLTMAPACFWTTPPRRRRWIRRRGRVHRQREGRKRRPSRG